MSKRKLMFVLVIIVSMVTLSFAQGRNFRNWSRQNVRANQFHTFDTTSPVEINGKIAKIEKRNRGYGRYAYGIELLVAEGNKNSLVHLGPVAYVNANDWQFKEGDKIRIIAFKGTGNSKGDFFAADINMSGKKLILRDKNGLPLWRFSLKGRGWRKGGRGGPGRGNRCW